jgi:hypothetical protein
MLRAATAPCCTAGRRHCCCCCCCPPPAPLPPYIPPAPQPKRGGHAIASAPRDFYLGFLSTMMTESPRRNILLMKRSLFTGREPFLPLPVLGICRRGHGAMHQRNGRLYEGCLDRAITVPSWCHQERACVCAWPLRCPTPRPPPAVRVQGALPHPPAAGGGGSAGCVAPPPGRRRRWECRVRCPTPRPAAAVGPQCVATQQSTNKHKSLMARASLCPAPRSTSP